MGRTVKINEGVEVEGDYTPSLPPKVHHPEVLLISSVLNTSNIKEIIAKISPEYFHLYRPEWSWIENFYNRFGHTPSAESFLESFVEFPFQAHIKDTDWSAERVRKNHVRRTSLKALNEVMNLFETEDQGAALSLMGTTATELSRIEEGTPPLELSNTDWFYENVKERFERAAETGFSGIKTGFPSVDGRTSGMQPGDLWIIAARLGQGKTWILARMAADAVLNDKKVLFISLEQPSFQIHYRVQTIMSRFMGHTVSNRSLISGQNVDLKAYRSFLDDLSSKISGSLVVVDPRRGKVTPTTVSGLIERHKPDVVFIDYITLMGVPGGGKVADDWVGVGKISQETKLVALTHNIPIVAAAQINRAGATDDSKSAPPPGVDKLSRSDSIGQDADVVITIQGYGRTARKALLAKVRSGEDGSQFYTSFKPDRGFIDEISMDEAQQMFADSLLEDA